MTPSDPNATTADPADQQAQGYGSQLAQLEQQKQGVYAAYNDALKAANGVDLNNSLSKQYLGPTGKIADIQKQEDALNKQYVTQLRDPYFQARADYYKTQAADNAQRSRVQNGTPPISTDGVTYPGQPGTLQQDANSASQNAAANQQNATTGAARLAFDQRNSAYENFVKEATGAHYANADELAKAQFQYNQLKDARDQSWDQYKQRVMQDESFTQNVLKLGGETATNQLEAAKAFMPAEFGQQMQGFDNALANIAQPGAWAKGMPSLPSAVEHLPFNPFNMSQDALQGAAQAIAHISPMAQQVLGTPAGSNGLPMAAPGPSIPTQAPRYTAPPPMPQAAQPQPQPQPQGQ